jgi:hypothetical protein
MKKFIIITSIFDPTEAIAAFSKLSDWTVVVVGDKKTNVNWYHPNIIYLSPDDQCNFNKSFSNQLPWNTYARKNLGYLYAVSCEADVIYETDDDNIPLENWVGEPKFNTNADRINGSGFVNIYSYFTDEKVWPRGFPLNQILSDNNFSIEQISSNKIGVWQFLADEDPDVDAIYRLTNNNPIYFNTRNPLVLSKGLCCPFNSQNTYFNATAFPLLYLPSTVTFRYTDILRGLIAQPVLWASDLLVGFGSSTVIQKRNFHDYLKDFESEIPCYLHPETVLQIALGSVSESKSISDNLHAVYENLLEEKIVTHEELTRLDSWLSHF